MEKIFNNQMNLLFIFSINKCGENCLKNKAESIKNNARG